LLAVQASLRDTPLAIHKTFDKLARGRWGDQESCAMPQADWWSTAPYDDKRELDAPGFAFEFLRRNPEFIRHHRRLERLLRRNALAARMRDSYAKRWGVRFQEGCTRLRKTGDPVDDDDATKCCPTYSCTVQS
jgi:hypothetical protein